MSEESSSRVNKELPEPRGEGHENAGPRGSGSRLNALLQRSMAALHGPFSQLVFLASLRDSYTGRYLHEGWIGVASTEEIHRTLRQIHLAAWGTVLGLPLAELARQLQQHFASLGGSERDMAAQWLESEPFRDTIPSGASKLEKEFFLSQMRAALGVLALSLSLEGLPEQSAWPRRQLGPQPLPRRDT